MQLIEDAGDPRAQRLVITIGIHLVGEGPGQRDQSMTVEFYGLYSFEYGLSGWTLRTAAKN